jgi:hypothetical protein
VRIATRRASGVHCPIRVLPFDILEWAEFDEASADLRTSRKRFSWFRRPDFSASIASTEYSTNRRLAPRRRRIPTGAIQKSQRQYTPTNPADPSLVGRAQPPHRQVLVAPTHGVVAEARLCGEPVAVSRGAASCAVSMGDSLISSPRLQRVAVAVGRPNCSARSRAG